MTEKSWILKSKDGRQVKVNYKSHYFFEKDLCPHLEFNGTAVSETGYLSHFFGSPYAETELDIDEVYKLSIKVMEEHYLPPQQVSLF